MISVRAFTNAVRVSRSISPLCEARKQQTLHPVGRSQLVPWNPTDYVQHGGDDPPKRRDGPIPLRLVPAGAEAAVTSALGGDHWMAALTIAWALRRRFLHERELVAWDVLGDGEPLVMLHGFPGNSFTWRHIAPALASTRRVYLVDLLGFGSSAKASDSAVSQPAQARLLARLLDHWGLDAPDIIAHDVGAAIALGALLFEGRVARRLVLIDAATLNPCISTNSRHVRRYLEAYETLPVPLHAAILRRHFQTTMVNPMSDTVFHGYFQPWSDAAGQAAYYRFLAQLDEAYNDRIVVNLHRVDQPTRIIWGDHDTWIPVSHAERLRALIPECELLIIPDSGHFIADDNPMPLLAAITDFVGD